MSLPVWDLSSIYKDRDSFLNDYNLAFDLTKEIQNDMDKKDIISLVNHLNELIILSSTINSFNLLKMTINTKDEEALKDSSLLNKLNIAIDSLNVRINIFLKENKKKVDDLCKGELKQYSFVLNEKIEEANHQMPLELEELAKNLELSTSLALSRLQDQIVSSSEEKVDGELKSVNELRSLSSSKDRSVRKAAFDAEIRVWKRYEEPLATCLNAIKGVDIELSKRRGYENLLELSLKNNRTSKAALQALVSSIEEYLPVFRKYLKLKAKLLNQDSLAFYDILAPVSEDSKSYSFDEAKEFILKEFNNFSPELFKMAKRMFDKNQIDAQARKNKVGGAFCDPILKLKEARILTNYISGSYSELSTIAHELGHAYHDYLVRNEEALHRNYGMTIAETASIFAEYLIFKGALGQSDNKKQEIYLIENFLSESNQVCVDVLGRYYFESDVIRIREKEELSVKEFCDLMLDAQKRSYGQLSEYHPYMWAVKGHYYMPSFPLYNYPYFFGQLFSLGLAAIYEKEGESFVAKYNELLRISGANTVDEIAKSVGIDITSKDFWKGSLDLIASYVQRLEKLIK